MARNAAPGLLVKNSMAYSGLIAAMTAGRVATSSPPSRASVANHRHITGPNIAPIFAVPLFWIPNNTSMMTTAIGTIHA